MLKAMARVRKYVGATAVLFLLGQTVQAETQVFDDGFYVFGPTDVLDNVVVEGDGILLLEGTTITGNLHVRDGGVVAASGATVQGNLIGNQAFLIDFVLSTFDGNVIINNTGGDGTVLGLLPAVALQASEVAGNVHINHNDVRYMRINFNEIDGNLHVTDNTATLNITIVDNVIGGNLRYRDNSPPPVVTGNSVSGNTDGD